MNGGFKITKIASRYIRCKNKQKSDGTARDAHGGIPNPSNKTIDWLQKNGWKIGE